MTFLLPGSAPARNAFVSAGKGTVKTLTTATTKTVDTLSGLPTIFKGSEGSLGRIRSNEVGAIGDLDNLPPATLGTYTDDFSVAAVPDAVGPNSVNVQLDVPAPPVKALSDSELIAQRVIDNQHLRNSPQFADDMAKVGVDDAMIARMWAKEAPLGFKSAEQFNAFKAEMDQAFKQADLADAEVGLKGTSTTFYSENPSKRLGHHWDADSANLGDYDINISSPTMKGRLDELGIAPSEKYGVFKTKDINNTFQPLDQFRTKWSGELGRDVNFVGYPKPVTRDATEYILRGRGATTGTTISASTPSEIAWGYGSLSGRQQGILDQLPDSLSQLSLKKSQIKVTDLAALTAQTGDEFALFTRGSQRLISDRYVLELMKQERSLILNSSGQRSVFDQFDNYRVQQ
ncbi:MAG: Rhs-family protein [Gammaproteobacteria bacterium]|nr:Rhs-family protein [Gammaproteobacteria bacterium]